MHINLHMSVGVRRCSYWRHSELSLCLISWFCFQSGMIAFAVCKLIITAEIKIYRSAVGPGFVIVKLEMREISVQERMFYPLNYISAPNPFIYHPGDWKRALSRLQVKRRISVIPKLQENNLPVPTRVENIYFVIYWKKIFVNCEFQGVELRYWKKNWKWCVRKRSWPILMYRNSQQITDGT